jgi:PPM family protein phosphatase
MRSQVAAATSTGLVRMRNEDSAYAGRWLCAVADGMGGHAAGDVASATVIEAIRPFDIPENDPRCLTAILGAAVRAANEQLTDKVRANPGLAGMGSTLTAMLWSAGHVAVANIGDSRAYMLRNQILTQITEDHVVSKLVESPMPAQISEHLVRYLDAARHRGCSPPCPRRAGRRSHGRSLPRPGGRGSPPTGSCSAAASRTRSQGGSAVLVVAAA